MGSSRSEQMSRIRGKNTTPERLLRSLLHRDGLRFRIHYRTPAGRPDIVFPRARVAVFVDGCFWHGCPEHYVRPRSSTAFWSAKLRENVDRDTRQTRELESAGWRVCRVWEHQVFEDPDALVRLIREAGEACTWRPGACWRVFRVDELDPEQDTERRFMRDLRDVERRRSRTQKRSTEKWKRPAGGPSQRARDRIRHARSSGSRA